MGRLFPGPKHRQAKTLVYHNSSPSKKSPKRNNEMLKILELGLMLRGEIIDSPGTPMPVTGTRTTPRKIRTHGQQVALPTSKAFATGEPGGGVWVEPWGAFRGWLPTPASCAGTT